MNTRKSGFILAFSMIALLLSACAGVSVQVPEQVSSLPNLLDKLPGVTISLGNEAAVSTQNESNNQANPSQVSSASLADYQNDLINVYEQVNPTVVNIRVVQKAGANLLGGLLPEMPFNLPEIPGMPELPQSPDQPGEEEPQLPEFAQALGSGFVWVQMGVYYQQSCGQRCRKE
jgi:S1-C subfamily serine protease